MHDEETKSGESESGEGVERAREGEGGSHERLARYVLGFLMRRDRGSLSPALEALGADGRCTLEEELTHILEHGGHPPNWEPLDSPERVVGTINGAAVVASPALISEEDRERVDAALWCVGRRVRVKRSGEQGTVVARKPELVVHVDGHKPLPYNRTELEPLDEEGRVIVAMTRDGGRMLRGSSTVRIAPASTLVVSNVAVVPGPGHDVVRVWNRGGLAGELTVTSGDGVKLAELLHAGMVHQRHLAHAALIKASETVDELVQLTERTLDRAAVAPPIGNVEAHRIREELSLASDCASLLRKAAREVMP